MNQDASKTLLYPFEAGALDLPEKTDRALFLGAEPGFRLPDGWAAPIHAVQGFRPDFRALERMGVAVTPRAEEQGYGVALVLAACASGWPAWSRSKGRCRNTMASPSGSGAGPEQGRRHRHCAQPILNCWSRDASAHRPACFRTIASTRVRGCWR